MFGQASVQHSSFVVCSLRWTRGRRQKSGFTVNLSQGAELRPSLSSAAYLGGSQIAARSAAYGQRVDVKI